jgi:hypothetical protein
LGEGVDILGFLVLVFREGRGIFVGVSIFGRSVVMNVYVSFCMLSSGLVMPGFSR